MSELAFSQMRIFELRSKLKERGLSSSGTKTELIARLTQSYAENSGDTEEKKVDTPSVQDKTEVEAAIPQQSETVTNEEELQYSVEQNTAPLEESAVAVNTVAIMTPAVSELGDTAVSQANSIPSTEGADAIAAVPVVQEEPEKEDLQITNNIDASLSVLEARCKRFGIPFDPEKYKKPQTQPTQVLQHKNVNNILEERRKRFGVVTEGRKVQNDRKGKASTRRLFDGMNAEEKQKMEMRMKRFGLSI